MKKESMQARVILRMVGGMVDLQDGTLNCRIGAADTKI